MPGPPPCLTSAEADRALSGGWEIVPHLRLRLDGSPLSVQLLLGAESGQSFQLLHSVDLVNWTSLGASVAYDSPIRIQLPASHLSASARASFYRVAHQEHAANDAFEDRPLLPAAGGGFSASFAQAGREANEPFHAGMEFMNSTIGWSWAAPRDALLEVQSFNGYAPVAFYTGGSLRQLAPVPPSPHSSPSSASRSSRPRHLGTTDLIKRKSSRARSSGEKYSLSDRRRFTRWQHRRHHPAASGLSRRPFEKCANMI